MPVLARPAFKTVSLALVISASVLVLDACLPLGDNEFDWYACILPQPQSSPQASPQPAAKGASVASPDVLPLYPKTTRLWGRSGTIYPKKIPICWTESAYAKPSYDESRETVRRAAEDTWEAALDIPGLPEADRIGFVGWQKCAEGERAVRLNIEDGRPYASGLGTDNFLSPGIFLNFEYANWSTSTCRERGKAKQFCIYKTAVHEFGHLLGLAHEHNRPDTDRESCTDAPQGSDGDVMVGGWDEHSVMNYCNPTHNNGGELSRGDVYGIQKVYYPAWFSETCDVPVVIASKPAGKAASPAAPFRSVARQSQGHSPSHIPRKK